MTTALITGDIFYEHETPEWHPESPDRLRAIMRVLAEQGILDHPNLRQFAPRPA
nr:hypothetical protein [Ktedonobacterales bacterium]